MSPCLQLVYDYHACRGSWKAAAEAQYRLAELLRGQQERHCGSAELLQQRAAALGEGLPGTLWGWGAVCFLHSLGHCVVSGGKLGVRKCREWCQRCLRSMMAALSAAAAEVALYLACSGPIAGCLLFKPGGLSAAVSRALVGVHAAKPSLPLSLPLVTRLRQGRQQAMCQLCHLRAVLQCSERGIAFKERDGCLEAKDPV